MNTEKNLKTEIATRGTTQQILKNNALTLKKSLGQNFLIDTNILQKMVESAGVDSSSGVLEIGPGIGALTQVLARAAEKVAAVEIDQRLLPILAETLREYDNVSIVHGDILKLEIVELCQNFFAEGQPIQVIANLPYYVTTPIMMKLLESSLPSLENIVIMVQKEVSERISARPGTKAYGSLSIAVQYYAQPEFVMTVPKTVFIPQPNVDSAVIKLKIRKQPPVEVKQPEFLFELARACFAQRRKTIYNNLQSKYGEKISKEEIKNNLIACGIEPSRRGETLTIFEYARLSERFLPDLA